MVYIESHRNEAHLERRRALEQRLYQDTQDLELLQESLSKTAILTGKIDSMLNSFDSRLGKLETSILPIHRSTQKLTKLYDHINGSLEQVQIVIDYFDLGTKEEPLIAKGPVEDNLAPFLQSVENLKNALIYLQKTKYKASERAVTHLKYTLTKALGQLNNLFRKWLTSASAPIDPLVYVDADIPTIPDAALKHLQSLSYELQTSSIGDLDFPPIYLKIYEEVRRTFLVKSLQGAFQAVKDQEKVDRNTYTKGTCAFVTLAKCLFKLLKAEKDLCNKLIPKASASTAFQNTITLPVETFLEIGDTMCGRIKRNVARKEYTDVLMLVDAVDGLSICLREFEGVIAYSGAKGNDVNELASQCKAVVVQALAQFYEEIKADPNKATVSVDGTVHELTSTTLNTLRRLVDFHMALDKILSDGANPLSVSTFSDLLSLVTTALAATIDQKAKMYKKPTLAAIFLMNNHHYVYKNLRQSKLADITKPEDIAKWEKSWGRHRESYRDSWKPVIEALTEKGMTIPPNTKTLSKSQRQAVKDKFKTFNSEFEDTYKQQKAYSVPDPDLRAVVIRDIKAILMPFFRGFHDKFTAMEFTKNQEKYVKYTPKTLETAIEKFFDVASV
ncbi:Cullin repeat-like-containing domain protein [Phlyctochytrium arcticum]|nr:Cullin repeat-like-containing domain protein [Phlyctochytrium arcticum]